MRIARIAAPLAACVVATLAVPATAGAAASSSTAAGNQTERVLLALTPSDRSGLRALARATNTSAAQRATGLQRALPSPAQRAHVAATVQSLGLHVEHVGTTAVAASGPADTVARLFGSARAVAPLSHVQHPLPRIPAALRDAVTVAFGGDDDRPAFRNWALSDKTADGGDFRTAYGDTVADPLTVAASSTAVGAASRNETIATVQLSGWNTDGLLAYRQFLATDTGRSWPTPRFSAVTDPFLPPNGNSIEVDLDQEALYAIAPYARQRAYLSGNDLVGMYDSLVAIGDDASDPTVDRHIVAASVSWGICESDLAGDPMASQFYAAMEDALSYDLAAGVTVFAASGDNGGTCDGTHPGVSYPASSPQVVSVGGTQQAGPTCDAAQTASQQGWADDSGASGGGLSAVFPRPAYQRDANLSSHQRAVPDIAALAGCPGFDVVYVRAGTTRMQPVGGTSLAAPVAAASYAVEVAQHGYSWGVGDLLPGLYGQADEFNDVDDQCVAGDKTCSGWNGVDVAHAGYDLVTGLGTPVWKTLVDAELGGDPHLSVGRAYSRFLTIPVTARLPNWTAFDHFRVDVDAGRLCSTNDSTATPPTSVFVDNFGVPHGADGVHQLTLVAWDDPALATDDVVCHFSDAFVLVDTTKPRPVASLAIGSGRRAVVASWRASDGADGSGVNRFRVRLAYQHHTVFTKTTSRPGSVRVRPVRGARYTLTVTATDRAGNSRATSARLLDDRAMDYARRWSHDRASTAFDKTLSSSTRRRARAVVRASGFAYVLYVTKCASCGKAAVYVGGTKRKTIDTYSSRTHDRVGITVWTTRRDASRKVVIKVLGRKRAASDGTRVIIDGLATRG